MKKLSLFLALMLLFSSIGLTAFAQEAQLSPRFNSYDEVNEAITVIPATDSQAELGYLKGITAILEVDGLQFKDLNGNGKLDSNDYVKLRMAILGLDVTSQSATSRSAVLVGAVDADAVGVCSACVLLAAYTVAPTLPAISPARLRTRPRTARPSPPPSSPSPKTTTPSPASATAATAKFPLSLRGA